MCRAHKPARMHRNDNTMPTEEQLQTLAGELCSLLLEHPLRSESQSAVAHAEISFTTHYPAVFKTVMKRARDVAHPKHCYKVTLPLRSDSVGPLSSNLGSHL